MVVTLPAPSRARAWTPYLPGTGAVKPALQAVLVVPGAATAAGSHTKVAPQLPSACSHLFEATSLMPYSTAATDTSSAAVPVSETVGPATVALAAGAVRAPVGGAVSGGVTGTTVKVV